MSIPFGELLECDVFFARVGDGSRCFLKVDMYGALDEDGILVDVPVDLEVELGPEALIE